MAIWTAFVLGLIGSLHCAGMCGPLALAVPCSGRTTVSLVTGRLLYNLGRIVTYGLLGLFFGMVGKSFVLVGLQRWASLTAGIVVILTCFGFSKRLGLAGSTIRAVSWLKASLASLLRRRGAAALLSLGLLNGLLPCGLVYVACASAVSQGSVLTGGLYMGAFGLGTLPMMIGIGLIGSNVQLTLRLRFQKWIPACMLVLGGLLILRGLALGIPYLSPNLLASPTAGHCH